MGKCRHLVVSYIERPPLLGLELGLGLGLGTRSHHDVLIRLRSYLPAIPMTDDEDGTSDDHDGDHHDDGDGTSDDHDDT